MYVDNEYINAGRYILSCVVFQTYALLYWCIKINCWLTVLWFLIIFKTILIFCLLECYPWRSFSHFVITVVYLFFIFTFSLFRTKFRLSIVRYYWINTGTRLSSLTQQISETRALLYVKHAAYSKHLIVQC